MRRLVAFVALFATPLAAQSTKASAGKSARAEKASTGVRYINPPGLAANPRFSQMVEINNGRIILISGQVAYDKAGNVVGKGDIRAQSTQVFENLKVALDALGASFNDVVKLNTFMVDMPSNLAGYREVRERYLAQNEHPPASTIVGVAALVNPDLLLEVEAVVVVATRQ